MHLTSDGNFDIDHFALWLDDFSFKIQEQCALFQYSTDTPVHLRVRFYPLVGEKHDTLPFILFGFFCWKSCGIYLSAERCRCAVRLYFAGEMKEASTGVATQVHTGVMDSKLYWQNLAIASSAFRVTSPFFECMQSPHHELFENTVFGER